MHQVAYQSPSVSIQLLIVQFSSFLSIEPPPPEESSDDSGLGEIAPIIGVVIVLIIIIIAIVIVIIVLM